MNLMKQYLKKFFSLSISLFTKVYEKIIITPLFGKSREVQHIWKPNNYLDTSSIYWYLIQKPLEKRGIYIPLPFKNIHDQNRFKTFHNEHLVLQKFLKLTDDNIENVFIDIGASDGVDMSNTFNLILQNYKGYAFELDDSKFAKMATIYRDYPQVSLFKTKVTPINAKNFLQSLDLPDVIKVLNLDIDSYDYYVLEELLKNFKFQFLILEFNPLFPMSVDFAVEFDENFEWEGGMFQGASVSMFYKLLKERGYSLIWIDGSFLLALNNLYINESISEIEQNDIDQILDTSLKENMIYKWEKYASFRSLSPEEIIIKTEENFKNFGNFYLKKSGF